MTTLAHISDIHLAPLPPVRPVELLSKRITGFLNWKLKRNHTLAGDGLTNLIRHMRGQSPAIVAVTGDLTNLALEAEINTAANWLQTVGEPSGVCVAPGNHDAYVPGALERAHKRWDGYMRGETLDDKKFPYVRRVGDIGVIACSSAVPTPPFFAAGRFSEGQAKRLARCLVALRDAGDTLPAGAVLMSPWTDLAATGQSLIDNDESDSLFFGSWVAAVAVHYLAGAPATDPRASPVYADLTGLPPLLIQVSGSEVLLDDSRRVAENARRAGVTVTERIWPGLPHVWQFFAVILPEGRAALREAGAFVRSVLS